MGKDGVPQKWHCKTCLHPKSGKPFLNFAENKKCFNCGIAKSACFGGHVVPAVPSKRAPWLKKDAWAKGPPATDGELAKCQAQIKRLEGELKKAKQQQNSASKDGMCWDVDNECEAVPDKDRLAAIDIELGTISALEGTVWTQIMADLRAERQAIEQRMLDSQPVASRLRTLLRKVDEAERQLVKSKKQQEGCRKRIVEAEQALSESDSRVAEQEQLLAKLKAQQAALAAQGVVLAAPQGASAAPPILQLDSEKVRQFLAQGLDELGVQVPDLSGFAVKLCERVPQCSQQTLVRIEAPVGQALAGIAGAPGDERESKCPKGKRKFVPFMVSCGTPLEGDRVVKPLRLSRLCKPFVMLLLAMVSFYFIILSEWQRLDLP
ncbi:unnamed protein product, partial [Prorocentrum cordatum]